MLRPRMSIYHTGLGREAEKLLDGTAKSEESSYCRGHLEESITTLRSLQHITSKLLFPIPISRHRRPLLVFNFLVGEDLPVGVDWVDLGEKFVKIRRGESLSRGCVGTLSFTSPGRFGPSSKLHPWPCSRSSPGSCRRLVQRQRRFGSGYLIRSIKGLGRVLKITNGYLLVSSIRFCHHHIACSWGLARE